MERILSGLTSRQKKLILVAVLGGGTTLTALIRTTIRSAQKEQKSIVRDSNAKENERERVAVNSTFAQRLLKILSICVPSPFSKEAGLILLQGILLVTRTLLTLETTQLEGKCAKYLSTLNFSKFYRTALQFGVVGIPAAIVNSLLKYIQKCLQVRFQAQLTRHLHEKYCSHRGYYSAVREGSLTNADQRITEDVEKFAFSITELYNHTFKPLLDVILFTRTLAPLMGYRGQFVLYGYYFFVAGILKSTSPPLSRMAAQEAALCGNFRSAHQRLSARAEEIAYNDPPGGISEELILNDHLQKLLRYVELTALQKAIQQIFDSYFVKYMASLVCLFIYAIPLQLRSPTARGTQDTITQDYVRSMRLLQNTSKGIGELILVYKRITTLAAHTSRVSVLMEQIDNLATDQRNQESESVLREPPYEQPSRLCGDSLKFDHVSIKSPDGTALLTNLTFEVSEGQHVLIMGPNGSGKTSLIRTLAGLWPIEKGTITTPPKSQVFYLSQQAYTVTGTLRDQLLYPDPPRKTWATASRYDRRRFAKIRGRGPGVVNDERLLECIRTVELEYLLSRGQGWNQQQKWEDTLSGGEKQRIAIARLLYHRPKFAILDEATSAVSIDGEKQLYQACKEAGISILSVGHRTSLRQFHDIVVNLGENEDLGWSIEEI